MKTLWIERVLEETRDARLAIEAPADAYQALVARLRRTSLQKAS